MWYGVQSTQGTEAQCIGYRGTEYRGTGYRVQGTGYRVSALCTPGQWHCHCIYTATAVVTRTGYWVLGTEYRQ